MVKIFVCYHKKDKVLNHSPYIPIQVGKSVAKEELDMMGDDTGDNISDRNPWYCELTAQYWIWKNIKDADYVGLCHYRRYLDLKPSFIKKFRDYIHENVDYVFHHSCDMEKIKKYDVILPKKILDPIPIRTQLALCHIAKDVDILEDIISELYPDFIPDYNEVIKKGCCYSPCNIVIARKDIYFAYTKWLFDILFEFEKKLSVPMHPYQARVMGFYSERLLNVYFHHFKDYKVGYCPMIVIDNSTNINLLYYKARKLIGYISCRLYMIFRGNVDVK